MRKTWIVFLALLLLLSMAAGSGLAQQPRVLVTQPADKARGISPEISEIKIFFNIPMKTDSYSAVRLKGYTFPPLDPDGPVWQDPQSFVLKLAKLEPGKKYGLMLNSKKWHGFKSADGTPLKPYAIRFMTAGQSAAPGGAGQPKPRPQPQPQPQPPVPPQKQPGQQAPAPQPPPAQPSQQGQGQPQAPMSEQDRIALHVMGGVVGVFFHELGHGLIDIFELPVTGREEDVVDEFSTMLLLYAREEGAEMIPEMLLGFADFFRLMAKYGGGTPWWDEHSPSMTRFGNVLCLLYGSSPNEFQKLVDQQKMPKRRLHFCRKEYPEKQKAWERILAKHLKSNGAKGNGVMRVKYAETKSEFGQKMQAALRQGQVFEQLAQGISQGFALPYDIDIVIGDCGQPNAFWDPEKKRIVVCLELIEFYAKLIEKHLSGDKGKGGQTRGRTQPQAPTPQRRQPGQPGQQGGGQAGGGNLGQTGQKDQRVIGLWGAQSQNQNITFTFKLLLNPQGEYHYVHEQLNMGMVYYSEEEIGTYTADGRRLTFKWLRRADHKRVRKGRGQKYGFNYLVDQYRLVLKGIPALKGKDLYLQRMQ
jgi:hypothetical protein